MHTVFSSPAVRAPFVGLVVPFATYTGRTMGNIPIYFLLCSKQCKRPNEARAEKRSGPAKKKQML